MLKAFSGRTEGLPNSQAIEVLNDLIAVSTTDRVDPSISNAEKTKKYKSFIVRYGQNNTRKEEFLGVKAKLLNVKRHYKTILTLKAK